MFYAGGIRNPEIFTVDQSVLSKGDSEAYLHRVEYQAFVTQPDTDSERGKELVFEDVGRVADEPEIGKSEQGDA